MTAGTDGKSAGGTDGVLDSVDDMVRAGDWRSAIDALTAAVRESGDAALAGRLVEVRHLAFDPAAAPAGPAHWPKAVPDLFGPLEGIPEVDAADLDARVIASAIQHHGSLHVHGLLPVERASRLLSAATSSREAREREGAVPAPEDRSGLFAPLMPQEGYKITHMERAYLHNNGGVYIADAPMLFFELIEALRESGVVDIVTEYIGEQPMMSVMKSAVRRAEKTTLAGWHQDGSVLGPAPRAVNVWIPLTHCGANAPGLEVAARRFDEVLSTGTHGAAYEWSIGDDLIDEVASDRLMHPEFAPGDALMFDQFHLHRLAVGPEMPDVRVAIECWLFAQTNYPDGNVPLVV